MTDIEQEIKWLREEISCDEFLIGSDSFLDFHAERIEENKRLLQELIEKQQDK